MIAISNAHLDHAWLPLALAEGDPLRLLALVAVAALAVGGELLLRRVRQRPVRAGPNRLGGRQPQMTAPRAQTLYRRGLFVFAPAAVAGIIAAARLSDPLLGLLVFTSVLATSTLMWPGRSPLHLMPVARVVVRFVLPPVGIALVTLPGLVSSWQLSPANALPSLAGASLVVAFAIWLEASFGSARPIRLAVIGGPELARKLALEMREAKIRDYLVSGFIGPEPEPIPDHSEDTVLPWLGELSEVRTIVKTVGIDLLAVGPDNPRLAVFEETANACLDLPVRMMEASALYEDVLGHVPIGQINSAWFQCIMHPRYSPTSPLSKRVLDVLFAVPVGLIALPVVPVLALIIKLSDGGPAFFRQRRVGEQGKEFDIVKLRTMRTDAGELHGHVPKDQMITPLGRLLRKTHLDELPQMLNVIKGDMTLVGPRPEQPQLVEELAKVVPYYARRSLVKPGVTGWAQVRCGYAGSQVGTAWKICHDLYYVKHRTILFDLLVIIQTIGVMGDRSDVELETPAEDFILGRAASLVSR